jgi:hypothetical protein
MGAPAFAFEASPRTPVVPHPQPTAELGDIRFRALMTERDWASLPVGIRRRFSKSLTGGRSAVYAGEILESRLSRAGWWLAQAARLIGGPLPRTDSIAAANATRAGAAKRHAPTLHPASVVTVTEGLGGQIWTRLYARHGGFPQVVHSAKRFAGPTGLEEYVGCGVGMTLAVYAREGALVFRSEGYFVELFGRRVFLAAWLTPGTLFVTHAELPDGKFSFTLQIFHPRCGLIIRQMAIFREVTS